MFPVLFTLGPFTLHTYGLMVALGCLLAIGLANRQAQREGWPPDVFLDLALWLIVAGIVGARLLYVATEWREFVRDPLEVFKLWDGGLVFYGAFILAGLTAWLYCRRRGLRFWQAADLAAPYIPLGHAIGRLGCFSAGCCYGRPSATAGVIFPALGDNIPHLPTQLYESAFLFALFVVLVWLRPRRRFEGQWFWIYVAAYAAGRFLLEFLRGDEIRGWVVWPWLHTSQAVGILAFGLAMFMLWVLGRRSGPGRA